MRKVMAVIAACYLLALGGLLMWFGQVDDSPGLGGLGLLCAVIGAVWGFDTLRGGRRAD